MRPLTPKQRRFVEALPTAKSGTDAAIKAGYDLSRCSDPNDMAHVIASENIRKPAIQRALKEINEMSKFAAVLSLAQRKERLSKLSLAEPRSHDPIRAIDILNKMDDVYTQHVSLSIERPLRSYSPEELRALLTRMEPAIEGEVQEQPDA